jgi:hypothetical protein
LTKSIFKKSSVLNQSQTVASFEKLIKLVETNTTESKIYKKSKTTIKNSRVKYAFDFEYKTS